MVWISVFDTELEGSIPSTLAQYVVTSGRRLGLEPRICRFEADRTDPEYEIMVVYEFWKLEAQVRFLVL